jgi:septal ring-binding cell division protein DamX
VPDDQIAALLEQAPLETANGNAAVPAPPAPPQVTAPAATQTAALTAGDVVLQLSSVRSEAAAAAEWRRLQAAHPQQLGDRRLTLETAEVQGTTYYRVQTGPFASRDAAAAVCTQLKARNQDCLVKQR